MIKHKHYMVLILGIVLICFMGVVSATSNDTVDNIVSEVNDNVISLNNDEFSSCMVGSDSISQDQNLGVSNDEQVILLDDEDDDGDDDETDYLLDEDDINEYIDDIKSSSSEEYFKFFTYLIKQKGFKFNIDSADFDEGYMIYASQIYESKLYDGSKYIILPGQSYFVSTNCRYDYILDTYYPDIIYQQNNDYKFDEVYLGWLKWNEQYKLTLNMATNLDDIDSVSYSQPVVLNDNSDLPSSFDLRKVNGVNQVSSVKNQSNESNCWAFAAIAGLESHLLLTENKLYNLYNEFDFSENNLKNVMSSIGSIGFDIAVNNGGNMLMSIAYFLRWSGPILESQDKYDTNSVIDYYKALKHVQGIKYIHKRNNGTDNDEIKRAIMDYGGVVTSMWFIDSFPYINNENNYYYVGNANELDRNGNPINYGHEICIVGWDNTYPANNFTIIPPGDGAFIVKNSWGSDWGDDGYFYISYYDTKLARRISINDYVGFSFTSVENNTNYGRNYHYTPLGTTFWFGDNFNTVKYRNNWIAYCDETLKACGVYVNNASDCLINVYVNGDLVSQTSSSLKYAGFHTILLDSPVKIDNGQNFTIEVILNSNLYLSIPLERPYPGVSKATSNHESEIYAFNRWYDISSFFENSNICLNAYTEYTPLEATNIIASDLTMTYGDGKGIVAKLCDSKGNVLKNVKLVFSINGASQAILTNDNGETKIFPKLTPGNYNIKIDYFGNEFYDSFTKMVKLIVNKPKPQNVVISLSSYEAGQNIVITLKSGVTPLNGEKININIGSKKYNNKLLDKNGKFLLKGKFTKKPAKIKIIYKGSDKFNKNSKEGYIYKTVKISGFKKSHKSDEKIVLKINVKKLNIKVTLNGISKKIKFSNSKATFNLKTFKLKKGKKYTLKCKSTNKYHIKNPDAFTIK